MKYTYDYTHRAFYERVYDEVLVPILGVSKNVNDRTIFIDSYARVEHSASEHHFGGGLKFWRNAGKFYVTCYPEVVAYNADLRSRIARANEALEALMAEMKPPA